MPGNLSSIQSNDDKDKSAIDKCSSIRGLGFLLLVARVAFVFAWRGRAYGINHAFLGTNSATNQGSEQRTSGYNAMQRF